MVILIGSKREKKEKQYVTGKGKLAVAISETVGERQQGLAWALLTQPHGPADIQAQGSAQAEVGNGTGPVALHAAGSSRNQNNSEQGKFLDICKIAKQKE